MDKTHTTSKLSVSLMQTLSPKASDWQSVTSGLRVRKDGLKFPSPFVAREVPPKRLSAPM